MPTRPKLSTDLIIASAMDILRSDGLDAVTLRNLAKRLTVEAPSLYRHVASKERLLALLAVTLFEQQLDQLPVSSKWQDWVRAFGRTLWATQCVIPDCAQLVLGTRFSDGDYAKMSAMATEPLVARGISPELAREMHLTIQAMILGLGSLAEGPNKDTIRATVPFEQLVDHSLEAMIAGWEVRAAR